jgi:uncharacterized protein YodC (DUF2158 family)
MNSFNVGDLVALKSVSPTMTVSAIGTTMVSCVWFDGSKKFQETFPPNALEHWVDVEARIQKEADAMTAKIRGYSRSLWS